MNPPTSLRSFHSIFRQAFRSHHTFQHLPTATPRTLTLPNNSVLCTTQRLLGSRSVLYHTRRWQSSDSRPLTDRPEKVDGDLSSADKIAVRKALSPAYQIWFTCKKCLERSGHNVSKQSYHFGTCVIQCPQCKSQHLISDHLKIFSDTSLTMEDIANQHGEKLRKGRLGADGDIEFYDEKDIVDKM